MTTNEGRKLAAWQKASLALGQDPAHVRRDAFGWYNVWSQYGDRKSEYGWEVDHVRPNVLGGGDTDTYVRALHWQNNARLGGMLGGATGVNRRPRGINTGPFFNRLRGRAISLQERLAAQRPSRRL